MDPLTAAVLSKSGPGLPPPVIVATTGGRDYSDSLRVKTAMLGLLAEFPGLIVIHGGARGADSLVCHWAGQNNVPQIPFPALWDDLISPPVRIRRRKDGTLYNAAAGPARNKRMLDMGNPSLVVAFPGGKGTEDMVRQARLANILVRKIVDFQSPKYYTGSANL